MKEKYTRCHNFYDWFCPDEELDHRKQRAIQFLTDVGVMNQFDDEYTWDIKNCCPVGKPLYDVVRIWYRDETPDFYLVVPEDKYPHEKINSHRVMF